MLVVFSFGNERFLTPFNASLIVQQVMFVGTLAIGQTIIILTAGIDLSVGAIAVFVSVIMGKLSADFGVPGVAALVSASSSAPPPACSTACSSRASGCHRSSSRWARSASSSR